MRIAGCLAGMLRKISPKPQGTEYIPCRESLGSERWIIAVTLQSKPLPFRSAYQVTVLHFGDFVLLFVCLFFLYTHKKTVDFIYFCIVLHFIFMGRFYGLFFYLRTLCFKMVWFTVPMEKKQFIAVTAAAAACAMQENHLASHTLVYHAAQRDTRAWLCKPAAGPLPILTLSLWTPLRCLCFNTGLSHLSTCFLALFLI